VASGRLLNEDIKKEEEKDGGKNISIFSQKPKVPVSTGR
jgi:hypothetical protein